MPAYSKSSLVREPPDGKRKLEDPNCGTPRRLDDLKASRAPVKLYAKQHLVMKQTHLGDAIAASTSP
jgi:hypothetical protein